MYLKSRVLCIEDKTKQSIDLKRKSFPLITSLLGFVSQHLEGGVVRLHVSRICQASLRRCTSLQIFPAGWREPPALVFVVRISALGTRFISTTEQTLAHEYLGSRLLLWAICDPNFSTSFFPLYLLRSRCKGTSVQQWAAYMCLELAVSKFSSFGNIA